MSRQSLLALFAGLSLVFGALPASVQAQTRGAENYTFAFKDAEISQVVQEVLGQAGQAFVLDPAVSGKISFRLEQTLSREQLIAALEAVLASNNIAMVRSNGQLLITPQSKARSTAEIRRGRPAGGPGYEIVAVPLSYAQPTEVARALEAISSSEVVLYTNDKLALLLLGGSGPQLQATIESIRIFDQSAFQSSKVRYYELAQAQATTVAAEVERIAQGAGLVGVTAVPLRRLNGVIVFGRSAESLDEIGRWVVRLDVIGKDLGSNLFVYRPQFTSAEALARTLGTLVGGGASQSQATLPPTRAAGDQVQSSAPAPTATVSADLGGGDDQLRIGLDRESNTLLVFASPGRWVQVQRILGEIDRPQKQVLIEASIVEVTLGRNQQFGIDWKLFSGNLAISSQNSRGGASTLSGPGISISYVNSDIQAALNALGSATEIQVISAPKIITLDNRTARLQVGDQVPVVTQASQSTNSANAQVINSVDYRSTGVILNVTPRISGDNRLILDVAQEVSSVGRTVTSGIDSPTIQQRRFESTLMIESGATVALGGLISSTQSAGNSGVPYIKDAPIIGPLFRTQSQDRSRSELIVLLSARVIDDTASMQRAMTDLAADMHELQARGLLAKP